MDEYTFRLATIQDKPAIVAFMHRHWDVRHPLIELPDFFDYYYNLGNGSLRFALCETGGRLAAIAGYIPASTGETPDIWVSIWVADKSAQGSGLELMEALPRLVGCRTMACNNIRPNTRPFYHFLGYTTGRMGHFYRLANRPKYLLARVEERDIPKAGGGGTLRAVQSWEELQSLGFAPPKQANPYKDEWYIRRRYFAYPRQKYEVYACGLPDAAAPAALLCARTIPAMGTAVLRIADYIGPLELLPHWGAAIDGLMAEKGAEYADLYCAGIPAETLRQAGFAERAENSPNVIPNYLDPPLFENTEYYYFTSKPEGFTMFKADGDQDRPNVPLE